MCYIRNDNQSNWWNPLIYWNSNNGLDCIAGTIDLLKLDDNNWIIGNDGTMELIELKQLIELTEFMELLESWLLLWIGGYDWIDRADGASGISGMKGGNDLYWWTCWNWWKF